MKILIIPDVHSRTFWKNPIEKYINEVDKIIFLGDYCDPYQDETKELITWEQTINNFTEIITLKQNNPDKIILLLGNHDMHYRNNTFKKEAKSTRFDSIHEKILYDIFNGDNYNLFQICYTVNNNNKKIIFTHAGITNFWLKQYNITFDDNIQETLNNIENTTKGINALTAIGKYRSWFGEQTGSPLWCDIREIMDDKGPNDVLQIFGHTRIKEKEKIIENNLACIDSRIAFMLNDDNELLTIEEYENNNKNEQSK